MRSFLLLSLSQWPRSIFAVTMGIAILLSGCGGGSANPSAAPTPTPTPSPPPAPAAACITKTTTITHTASTANPAQVVFLDLAKYPQATCNDGSPAAYVFRPGAGAAASRWVILLQGGNDCFDQPTCLSRAGNQPQLISSSPYQSNPSSALALDGIQSPTPSVNPDFYDANQVQALYCSSDDWSGAYAGSGPFNAANVATWNFQGHAILAAVFADLEASHGLASATEVLFTGESAGGVGVFANVNTVAKLVPASARFISSADGAFANSVDNFDAAGSPPNYTSSATAAEVTKYSAGLALWNGSGDSVCASTATTPTEQVDCYSAARLLGSTGTIPFPMLVIEAQKDTSQLATDGVPQQDIASGNLTAAESGYVTYFASQMRAGLAATNANVSLFSPDALVHTEANSETLFSSSYSFPGGSFSLQQVVSSWYQAPCTVQRDIAN